MGYPRLRKPCVNDGRHCAPGRVRVLTAARECMTPENSNAMPEVTERRSVSRYGMIREVSAHDCLQPSPLEAVPISGGER